MLGLLKVFLELPSQTKLLRLWKFGNSIEVDVTLVFGNFGNFRNSRGVLGILNVLRVFVNFVKFTKNSCIYCFWFLRSKISQTTNNSFMYVFKKNISFEKSYDIL